MTGSGIIRVITRLNIGGPARHALLLADAMESRGYPSHLVWGTVSRGEGEFRVPEGTPSTHLAARPAPSTGPYRVGAFEPGRRLLLVRNPVFTSGRALPSPTVSRIGSRSRWTPTRRRACRPS